MSTGRSGLNKGPLFGRLAKEYDKGKQYFPSPHAELLYGNHGNGEALAGEDSAAQETNGSATCLLRAPGDRDGPRWVVAAL